VSDTLTTHAIKAIEDLSNRASRSRIEHIQGTPAHKLAVLKPDGEVEWIDADASPIAARFETPEELLKFLIEVWEKQATVFIGRAGIVAVRDLADRRETASCVLPMTEPFSWISGRASQGSMSQAELVRILRITFAGCLADSNLLFMVRQLKFEAASTSLSSIQHGKESMGKSVDAATFSEGRELPEGTRLTMPAYLNYGLVVPVQCALEVLVKEQQFKLIPLPGQIDGAYQMVMGAIMDIFTNEELSAFMGVV
jgi:hypothetical protein